MAHSVREASREPLRHVDTRVRRSRRAAWIAHRDFVGDVAATAKRDLAAGETLDGEGGFTVYGKLPPARTSLEHDALPVGLAHGVALKREIGAGDTVRWDDVAIDSALPAVRARREMEARGVAA